jgi:hypothetical protein
MGETRNSYKILVRKTEEKRPLGRPRRRQKYNIRLDLRETEWEAVDWKHLAQDRDQWQSLVKMIFNLLVP